MSDSSSNRDPIHDALVRKLLEHPSDAAGVLEVIVPTELASAIDWSRLERRPARRTTPTLGHREADGMFRAPLSGGGEVQLALILEHWSRPNAEMALRAHRLQADEWARQVDAKETLSPVVILVLHHGARPWRVARSMRERLRMSVDPDSTLARTTPSSEYVVYDLAGLDLDALAELPIRSATTHYAFFLLQRARISGALHDELPRFTAQLAAISRRSDAESVLVAFFEYVGRVAQADPEKVRLHVREAAGEEMETLIMGTMAQQWVDQGRAEGRIDGERRVLLRLLGLKFGVVDEALRARIEAATTDELEAWAERLLVATSVDEVFANAP